MSIIKKDGYNYSFNPLKCNECGGKCCIGKSGYIWVTPKEILSIANFLKIELEEFKKSYLVKVGYRYSLKERFISKDNYECIFFDSKIKGCSIYFQRPSQCRSYPFWDYFKNNIDELKKECIAINKEECEEVF